MHISVRHSSRHAAQEAHSFPLERICSWTQWSMVKSGSPSLQKVQGHRTAQDHRAVVEVDVPTPTGVPVGHPPPQSNDPVWPQGSKSWHSWSFAKYSDIGLVTISFPACCVSHRATGLPVMVHDMHTRRRLDYLQACSTGPPVDGVKSALTPALYLLQWPLVHHSWCASIFEYL